MARLVTFLPEVAARKPFPPGPSARELKARYRLSDLTLLASNESPLPPFPAVLAGLPRWTQEGNRYPEAYSDSLRARLAERTGTEPGEILVFNGSAEGIML